MSKLEQDLYDVLSTPPTEVEISQALSILYALGNHAGGAQDVIRRLAFQRDNLKRTLDVIAEGQQIARNGLAKAKVETQKDRAEEARRFNADDDTEPPEES